MEKFDIKYFANLARIKLTSEEEGRFSGELKKVLDHIEELKGVNSDEVAPMSGGTSLRAVWREDNPRALTESPGKDQFPRTKEGFLSVPKIFGEE